MQIESAHSRHLDDASLLSMAARSVALSSSDGLRDWLAQDMQPFLPHEKLLVAWGNLRSGGAVSWLAFGKDARGQEWVPATDLTPQLREVFERWLLADRRPIAFPASEFVSLGEPAAPIPPGCVAGLAHGLADERRNGDFLYVFIGPQQLCTAQARHASSLLLPFIDSGLRRHVDVRGRLSGAPPGLSMRPSGSNERAGGTPPLSLSSREVEIMDFVCRGLRNHEIAIQLGLSKATVKNHMHRIFQKLDVLNRAQAVETFAGRAVPHRVMH